MSLTVIVMKGMRFVLMLLVVSTPSSICGRRRHGLRVLYGRTDTQGKYPYVVALVSYHYRQCTGTLLSSEWVLTAGHCIICDECFATSIQYGDMTLLPNDTNNKSRILQMIRHPGYRDDELLNDIAMLKVEPVPLKWYGKLSAIDYEALIGHSVEYAGYGTTENDADMKSNCRPLIIGEGVVRSCLDLYTDDNSPAPCLCVAPKCTNKQGDSAPGDSGGPLFYDGKIVGVVSTGIEPIGLYASVSPYMTWISQVMYPPEKHVVFK